MYSDGICTGKNASIVQLLKLVWARWFGLVVCTVPGWQAYGPRFRSPLLHTFLILKMSRGFALWNLWDNCKMTCTAAHLQCTIILVVTNVASGGGSIVLGTRQNSLSPTPLDLGPCGTRTLNWLNDWAEVFHHPNVPWALRLAWLFDFPNLLNCLFYSLRKVWTGLFAILYCGSCVFFLVCAFFCSPCKNKTCAV